MSLRSVYLTDESSSVCNVIISFHSCYHIYYIYWMFTIILSMWYRILLPSQVINGVRFFADITVFVHIDRCVSLSLFYYLNMYLSFYRNLIFIYLVLVSSTILKSRHHISKFALCIMQKNCSVLRLVSLPWRTCLCSVYCPLYCTN